MRKDWCHHTVVFKWLRRLTILNANTRTPPSLGRVYIALPWNPKVVELCIVHLSLSELSGFADVTVSPLRCKVMQYYWKYIDYKSDKMIDYDRLSQSTINNNTTSPNDASCVVCANSKSFFY